MQTKIYDKQTFIDNYRYIVESSLGDEAKRHELAKLCASPYVDRLVHRAIHSLGFPTDRAEDALSHTIIKLLNGKTLLPPPERIVQYLITAFKRNAIKLEQENRQHPGLPDCKRTTEAEGDSLIESLEDCSDSTPKSVFYCRTNGLKIDLPGLVLDHAFGQLSQEEMRFILLRMVGSSWETVANTMGVGIGKARYRYHQAIQRLRAIIERAISN